MSFESNSLGSEMEKNDQRSHRSVRSFSNSEKMIKSSFDKDKFDPPFSRNSATVSDASSYESNSMRPPSAKDISPV